MWIPAGVVYVVAGLLFVVGWLRESDRRVQIWEASLEAAAMPAGNTGSGPD